MAEDRMLSDEILLGLIKKNGGGGGGTSDYNPLSNKPQINGNTLIGNKSAYDLGLADSDTVDNILDGQEINSFGDVENALSNKQGKLTAGNYIAIENDGTIKVTQGMGVYDVYSYKIEGRISGTQYYTNVIKYKNGVQQSSNTYYNTQATTPINIDDRFTLKYVMGEVTWHVILLTDSTEHSAGEDISWRYNITKDFTEIFNVSQDSSTDLATKGDVSTALADKQDILDYSTTEQNTGQKWIDNKDIYIKTISLAETDFTKTNNWFWRKDIESLLTGYETIVNIYGDAMIEFGGSRHLLPFGSEVYFNDNSDKCIKFANYYRNVVIKGSPYNDNDVNFNTNSLTIVKCNITVAYTKATT